MSHDTQPAPVPLTKAEEEFLRALTRAILTVPRAFDADLLREQGMSMSEYTVLRLLSEAPDARLRIGDLAEASALSISGITRVVNRLEKEDLVRRERSSQDGRGCNAVLTDSGLLRLRQAWPAHLASVRRHVMDHVGTLDLPAVTTAFQAFTEETPRQHTAACATS